MKGKANKVDKDPVAKFKFGVFYALFLLVIVLIAGEIGVRVLGHSEWSPPIRNTVTDSGKPFFRAHTDYGFIPNPKNFIVNLNGEIAFSTQHDSLGFRIPTQPLEVDSVTKKEVWILGGSFTYGWGLDFELTFPAILQESLPDFKVRNFGIPAWGPHQNYLFLENEFHRHDSPALVIMAYASFHNQRVTCNDYWLKALAGQSVTKNLSYPFFRVIDGVQSWGMMPLVYQPYPLQRQSALVHFLEDNKCSNQEGLLDSPHATEFILRKMEEKATEMGAEFLLVGLEPDSETNEMLSNLKESGVVTLDISVDRNNPGMSLEPFDPHPSAEAHKIYAKKLIQYLLNTR